METLNQLLPGDDNRTFDYDDANDRLTFMTSMVKCINHLEAQGFADQFKVEGAELINLTSNKTYQPHEVEAVNFYRFEGITDPEDMAILYVIITVDGSKGTSADGYGPNADGATAEFMKTVEISKKVQQE